ncbi:MAG: class III signal peptide-containing protein [archaeon]|jgi:uncharacterized protein (UPF0333 family)
MNTLNKLIKEKKGQVSVEALLIVGIIVLAAILVGYYLKQMSYKNSVKIKGYQDASTAGKI